MRLDVCGRENGYVSGLYSCRVFFINCTSELHLEKAALVALVRGVSLSIEKIAAKGCEIAYFCSWHVPVLSRTLFQSDSLRLGQEVLPETKIESK